MALSKEKAELKINDKQEVFCQEYCNNGYNGSDAYKTAYPKCKSGHRQSAKNLLTKPYIKERIKQIKEINEAWSDKNRNLLDKLFKERYQDCVKNKDNSNAIRCLENKAKNVGYYEADNAQRNENKALLEQQEQDLAEFMAWKQRQMLRPGKTG